MTTTIDGVFFDLTGALARSGISAASFAELSDDQSENTHLAIARLSREVARHLAPKPKPPGSIWSELRLTPRKTQTPRQPRVAPRINWF